MSEVIKGRFTWTETGYPLTVEQLRKEGFRLAIPADGPGWFFIAATASSAANIRRHGHKAVGTVITSFYPPQTALEVLPHVEPEGDHRVFNLPDGRVLAGASFATAVEV